MSSSKGRSFRSTKTPEVDITPEGWEARVAHELSRVYFVNLKTKDTTFQHPTLGPLPRPWILNISEADTEVYYNRDTKVKTTKDPRYHKEALETLTQGIPKDLATTASIHRNTLKGSSIPLEWMKRAEVGIKNIRDQFKIVKTIDDGSGEGGEGAGAMNGGVFVVRYKDSALCKLYVEKRFKDEGIEDGIAKKEIEIMQKAKHPSLAHFIAAFMTTDPAAASVYIEFCDRGGLDSMIRRYYERRKDNPRPLVPERFIWHAFTGLCDGLSYLATGKSHFESRNFGPKEWYPILHRDLKPENVLLRSRATIGSEKYFYCVISDFGLACEEEPSPGQLEDPWQREGLQLGTQFFFAPELLYNPYPKNDDEERHFPINTRHSRQSDLWALGASSNINLCETYTPGQSPGAFAHIDWSTYKEDPKFKIWFSGTISRKEKLEVSNRYSRELRDAILYATRWEKADRPDAAKFMPRLVEWSKKAGFKTQAPEPNEKLPTWATRVHIYDTNED